MSVARTDTSEDEALPIAARIILIAFCFRLVSAPSPSSPTSRFLHTDQGFAVLGRPPIRSGTFALRLRLVFGIASKGWQLSRGRRNNGVLSLCRRSWGSAAGCSAGDRRISVRGHRDLQHRSRGDGAAAASPVSTWARRLAASGGVTLRSFHRRISSASSIPEPVSLFARRSRAGPPARRWAWAALAGIAMTATRVNGIMLVPALLVIAWMSAHPGAAIASVGSRPPPPRRSARCVLRPSYALSGDPLACYHSIER
jgi:hypothetical protein